MSEPTYPLPADHVFVLQLQESQGWPGPCRRGRVEHLASGEATRFGTTAELWDFVDRVLTATTEHRQQGPRGDREDDS